MNGQSVNSSEIDTKLMEEIIKDLEHRSYMQSKIYDRQSNSDNQSQHYLTNIHNADDSHEILTNLIKEKAQLDLKLFNQLQKQISFQSYYSEGYATQFRACFNYFQYKVFNIHQKVFEQDCSPDNFYIILKGKIGLYSKQQLYYTQDGFQYQANQFIKLQDSKKQSQQQQQQQQQIQQQQQYTDTTPKSNRISSQNNYENQYYLVKVLGQGQQFGEISLLMNFNRTTSAIAVEDNTVLLQLNCQHFLEILRIREESKLYSHLTFIKECSSINFLSFNALKDIYVKSYTIPFKRDTFVCLQNQYPLAAYIIKSGQFSLWSTTQINSNKAPPKNQPYQTTLSKFHTKQEIKMSLLGEKEIFGDIEIISQQNYAYSLKCESDGDVLIIPKIIYETKVMQNDMFIDVIKNKSSKINQKRLALYQNFSQNLEIYRHFMYDADDTDEEDSGKINQQKGYEVFKKSKVFKNLVQEEKQLNQTSQNYAIEEKKKLKEKYEQTLSKEKNGLLMKELTFLDNVNYYDLNNQDKKNFYFTFKGEGDLNKTPITLYDNFKQKNNSYSPSSQLQIQDEKYKYKAFPADFFLKEGQHNQNVIAAHQQIGIGNTQSTKTTIITNSVDPEKKFKRNIPRPQSKASCESRKRGSSFSFIPDLNNYKTEDLQQKSVCNVQEDHCVQQDDTPTYSPSHSINRKMQEEYLSQLSQRLGKDDASEATASQQSKRNTKRMTSREQRKVIKLLQKQNQELFKLKIDPKLKQKMVGYEKNQNFISDYREENLQIPRNALHADQILKQLNYEPDKLKEFIKFHQQEEDEQRIQNPTSKKCSFSTNNQSQRNKSLPQQQQNNQHFGQQFIPYSRRQSCRNNPLQIQDLNGLQDQSFLLAKIQDSATPQTANSSRNTHNTSLMDSNRSKILENQLIDKKPQTAKSLSQRCRIITSKANQQQQQIQQQLQQQQLQNVVQKRGMKQQNRESNSSFGTNKTMISEIEGFDQSQQSLEVHGYDINQYRQERMKSQSFSFNIMSSNENIPAIGFTTSRNVLQNKIDTPFNSRRSTINNIVNTGVMQGQQKNKIEFDQKANSKQLQQQNNFKPQQNLDKIRKQYQYVEKNMSTKNSDKNTIGLVPETLICNQILIQKQEDRASLFKQNDSQNIVTIKEKSQIKQDYNQNNNPNQVIKNQFVFHNQTKAHILFQKSQKHSRNNSQNGRVDEQGVLKELVCGQENNQRYISLDFRRPSYIKQKH